MQDFIKRNLKWLLVACGLVLGVILAAGTAATTEATSSSGFCKSCHDSNTFTTNIAKAPHANVECITCHTKGVVTDKTKGIKKAVLTVTGSKDPNNYEEIKAVVSNDKCLSCHQLDNAKRDPYRAIRHEGYLRKDFNCTRCHDSISMHGKLTQQ